MVRTQYDAQYVTNMQGLKGDYMGKAMPHNNMNYQDYSDRCSDIDDKQHVNEKYLFPYTAEEDHVTTHNNYIHPGSRIMSPVSNDINNPGNYQNFPIFLKLFFVQVITYHINIFLKGIDYHVQGFGSRMGSRMGSVLGSVHGSACGSMRGSPSPLMPPVSMMHSAQHPDAAQ